MTLYIFFGLGLFWLVMGLGKVFTSGGQGDELKAALAQLLMAGFNLAIAWYLYWRRERRTDWRR